MQINGKTLLYGIMGNPVRHSLSPSMHNAAFEELGVNSVYVAFEVTDVEAALAGMRGLGICGASVTIPHKQKVMEYLDYIDPVASKIGAINTIKTVKTDNGLELHGSNTDWLGANLALEQELKLSGKKVVLLGAGGAARAIGFGLQEVGAEVALCSRTEQKGRDLAGELDCEWNPLRKVTELSGEILVNATSVGMYPNIDESLLPKECLSHYQLVMDIVYAPLNTQLLKDAAEIGCKTVNGLEMLLYQGVAQFETWTERKAPVDLMRRILLEATGNIK